MVHRETATVFAAVLLASLILCLGPALAESILGTEVETFLKERVRFGGFLENTSGLSISHGDRHFSTSNRFIMERFTFQPEFNVDLHEQAKFFISWRFVKEPRYNAEALSRRKAVSPQTAANQPLDSTFYDEDSPKPWEALLDLTPTDRLSLRFGRQFISWGETDGLRLLDVINPADSTFSPPVAPNLFDLDETRIPIWALRATYTVFPVTNTILEFFAAPGWEEAKQRVDDVMGSNDTADRRVRYGRWSAHPETRIAFGRLVANLVGPAPVVVPVVGRVHPDAGDAWKIGGRATHNIGAFNFGLGYIWGYNPQGPDMVFKRLGDPILCGPPACPPGGTLVRLKLMNDRTHIFAGHFNYTIGDVAGIPVSTAIRGEIAFYPDQPYNHSEFPGRNCVTGAPTGLKAGPSCSHRNQIVEKNTLRYSLGFDRTTLIPFLQDDPWRAFRMSFQIFQRIIFDHEDGIRTFSTAEKIETVSTTLTFRVSTGYRGDTILPDVFVAYDPLGYWAFNPGVTYAPPWNERIKFTLTAAIYGGRNKFGSLGLFSEKDSVFLKMRYQFGG